MACRGGGGAGKAEGRGACQGPAPVGERSIVVNRKGAPRDTQLNLLQLRNTINYHLRQVKAPENTQVAGIQWNNKVKLTLMTYFPFSLEEMGGIQATIEKVIQQALPGEVECTKSEVWAKLIMHGIPLEDYSDDTTGMNGLIAEIEKQNNCELTTPLRYLTKPENRNGKTHSSIVIAIRDKQEARQMIQ